MTSEVFALLAVLCWPANALPGSEPGCQFITSEPLPISECHALKERVTAVRNDGEWVAWTAFCAVTAPSSIARRLNAGGC